VSEWAEAVGKAPVAQAKDTEHAEGSGQVAAEAEAVGKAPVAQTKDTEQDTEHAEGSEQVAAEAEAVVHILDPKSLRPNNAAVAAPGEAEAAMGKKELEASRTMMG
jgi:hypothetical protein